ncbi:MAG: hypothetical protein J1F05_00880 [Muribaculaceae bacterium]|nr:hypothetical protein [Muribaculaceae bacterium]
MKEYDETEAVRLMGESIPAECRDTDSICEVLDLIYDYYDENGDLDIDIDEEDADVDITEIVMYIEKSFRKNAPTVLFTTEQITAMVKAEIAYEESLV